MQEAYEVLYEGKDPRAALDLLMTRSKQNELEDADWEK